MPASEFQLRSQLRWTVYTLLIVISASVMVARVMSVTNRHQRTPFLSANDRSRIATMRALVEHGTYAIDEIIYKTEDGKVLRDENDEPIPLGDWHTIDMVRHPDRDGVMRSYSSKPTLLPTILAGEYWLVHKLTNTTLGEEPFYVGRILLVLTNIVPLVLYLFVMAYLIDDWGSTDWGRLFAMSAAAFATFLTTFAVTLNNHLPAAISCSLAVLAALKIWYDGDHRWFWFVLAGLFGAFTAANELPALSFFCMLSAALLWKAPLKTLLIFTPCALLVIAGIFGTNYLAHDSWKTPYAHRGDGPVVATLDDTSLVHDLNFLAKEVGRTVPGLAPTEDAEVVVDDLAEDRWQYRDRDEAVRFAIVKVEDQLEIREWDDWYRFQGAYWRSGDEDTIDAGEPSALLYAFHCTLGHHGLFSLTPIWLLALAGTIYLLVAPKSEMRAFAMFVAVASLVVLAFYLSRGQIDRNYGGWTSGLRWMFWFTPMWLLMLLPAADWTNRSRWLKGVALLLLAASIFSAFYASGNPWTHPWLYNYWTYLEWVPR